MITPSTARKAEVASPCINICRIGRLTGYCESCRRTIAEIAAWSSYSDAEKRAVLEMIAAR